MNTVIPMLCGLTCFITSLILYRTKKFKDVEVHLFLIILALFYCGLSFLELLTKI
jgi:hypothetical protein